MHPVKRLADGHAGCGRACVLTGPCNEFKTRAEHGRHEYKWLCALLSLCFLQDISSHWPVSFKQTNLSWSSLFSRSLDLVQYTHFLTCDCSLHNRAILTHISPQCGLSIIHCFFGTGWTVVSEKKLMVTNFLISYIWRAFRLVSVETKKAKKQHLGLVAPVN